MSNAEHLARVSAKIAETVHEFAAKQGVTPFVMAELNSYVNERYRVAPDSPGRILRALRRAHALNYSVVSRKDSRYVFVVENASACN